MVKEQIFSPQFQRTFTMLQKSSSHENQQCRTANHLYSDINTNLTVIHEAQKDVLSTY